MIMIDNVGVQRSFHTDGNKLKIKRRGNKLGVNYPSCIVS